jgi:cell division protein FtsZ
MKGGGSAIMGTGIGRGENRAIDAAQQAISSPLLDNVSIAGARGVLINITGGENDMGLGEVTQISEIIKDAVGEESEIIFGAVPEPAMQGELRVTVIATGFDTHDVATPAAPHHRASAPVIALPVQRQQRAAALPPRPPLPAERIAPRPAKAPRSPDDVSDMEIPTFIRRQMD